VLAAMDSTFLKQRLYCIDLLRFWQLLLPYPGLGGH
jgi:hypothetical protein